METHFFQCPYCWQEISMRIDTSVEEQTYVEDCEVCCQPIQLQIHCKHNALVQAEISKDF